MRLLASSAALLAELQGVRSREKFAKQLARRGLTVGDVFNGYAALVVIVTPAVIAPTIIRDPADDQVLAAALAAQVDLIDSGAEVTVLVMRSGKLAPTGSQWRPPTEATGICRRHRQGRNPMITVQITLPDTLAQEEQRAGLLSPGKRAAHAGCHR